MLIVTDNNKIERPGGIESFIRRVSNCKNAKVINFDDIRNVNLSSHKTIHIIGLKYTNIFYKRYWKNIIITPFTVFNHVKKNIYSKIKLKLLLRKYKKIHAISPRISKFLSSIGINNTLILPPVDKKFFVGKKKRIR